MKQMKYIISFLLLTVFCWQPVVAQSDIELTDSTSTEWGDNVGGGFLPNMPYYEIVYILDGIEYKRESIVKGNVVIVPEAPAKEGHTFAGWTNVPATMPAKDITVTGTYTINKYTLTYMVDGTVYKTSELEYGATITAEAAPIKEGYLFSGWSEIPETMPAKDIEVTGHFEVDGIDAVLTDQLVDVYTLQGVMLKRQISVDELKYELSSGIYIINGKKVVVR